MVGIVSAVADANNFTLQTGGRVTGLSGLTAGTVYYVDDDTAGLLTSTEPTDTGDISKPVLIADTTTSGFVFNMRGFIITPSGGGGGGGGLTVLSDTTLGADGTFDISGISDAHDHLLIKLVARGARSADFEALHMRLNNDSGSNYDMQGTQDFNSQANNERIGAPEFGNGTSAPYVGIIPAATSPSGSAGIVDIEIPFYSGTTFNKNVLAHSTSSLTNDSGNQRTTQFGGEWRNTAAVTRIQITCGSGANNFLAGSRLIIYGV